MQKKSGNFPQPKLVCSNIAKAPISDLAITTEVLCALMPLHILLDKTGHIISFGPTIRKFFSRHTKLESKKISDCFHLKKPSSYSEFDRLEDLPGKKLLLETNNSKKIKLNGMLVPVRFPDGWLLSLSLGSRLKEVIHVAKLNKEDFSLTDSSIDLMYVLKTQAGLLESARELAKALENSKVEARKQALTDTLTGLPNRRATSEYLNKLLTRSQTGPQAFCLMHIDLDNFKDINDLYGHAAGDRLLKHVSHTMSSELESHFIARFGGDEFIAIIEKETNEKAVGAKACKLIQAICEPMTINQKEVAISASIGIAFSSREAPDDENIPAEPEGKMTSERLLIDADLALYQAKEKGKGKYQFFDLKLKKQFQKQKKLLEDIHEAIEQKAFTPWFQPKVDILNGNIVGVEALARWEHPERGLLTPWHFLEDANRAGLTSQIDEIIMHKAFETVADWSSRQLDIPQVSINVTADRLADESYIETLNHAALNANISAERIGLEILETVLLEGDSRNLVQAINKLDAMGYSIELDDFGTGYASISNLRKIPVEVIKIDRSLISNIQKDKELQKITGAIIDLAYGLEITPLAEGVENAQELQILQKMGCNLVQGYYIARPMDTESLYKWAREFQPEKIIPSRKEMTTIHEQPYPA